MIIKYDQVKKEKNNLTNITKTAIQRLDDLLNKPSSRTTIISGSLISPSDITSLTGTQLSASNYDFQQIKSDAAKQLGMSDCNLQTISEYDGNFKGWKVTTECFEGDMTIHVDIRNLRKR